MSVRPRCGAASRCINCESEANRNGKRRRCGCEAPLRGYSLRKSDWLRECALVGAEECEIREKVCVVQCTAYRSLRKQDVNVYVVYVSRSGYEFLIHKYECIVIDTSRERAIEKKMTESQQYATGANAATLPEMRHCDGHKLYFNL